MTSWWDLLSEVEQIFWGIATISSVIFLIQALLSLIGADGSDVSSDADIDVGASIDGDADFTFFSIRGIIAFFLLFGWSGIIVLKNDGSNQLAFILATIAGLCGIFITSYLVYSLYQLQEKGNIQIRKAINQEGEVYLKIPGKMEGKGKVMILLQGKITELEAMTKFESIPTGEKIRVIKILDDNVLLVESLQDVEKNK